MLPPPAGAWGVTAERTRRAGVDGYAGTWRQRREEARRIMRAAGYSAEQPAAHQGRHPRQPDLPRPGGHHDRPPQVDLHRGGAADILETSRLVHARWARRLDHRGEPVRPRRSMTRTSMFYESYRLRRRPQLPALLQPGHRARGSRAVRHPRSRGAAAHRAGDRHASSSGISRGRCSSSRRRRDLLVPAVCTASHLAANSIYNHWRHGGCLAGAAAVAALPLPARTPPA